jgi:hypothetical protein
MQLWLHWTHTHKCTTIGYSKDFNVEPYRRLLYRMSCLWPFFPLCFCVPLSLSHQSTFLICRLIWALHPHYIFVHVHYFFTFVADLLTHDSPPCLFYPSPFCVVPMIPIFVSSPRVLLKRIEQLVKCLLIHLSATNTFMMLIGELV